MSEWKEYKIKDVAQLVKDTWKVGDEKFPYIALEHIVEGGLRLQGIGDSNTIASNKFRFNTSCFLFGKLRPYFRKLYRPNFEGICSTDIWVIKPKGENDKDFLFYFFANQEFVDFTYSGSSGTRMPRADWNFVSQSKWNFPELPEQKAIAEVLSSLDDKIDLLHRQNKTLEQMAETLFRQWFVEEAKDDWEIVKIGDYLDVLLGGTPSTKNTDYWNGDIPWINSSEINKDRILHPTKMITKAGLENSSTKLLPKGTTVLAITGATLGQVSRLEIDACANQSVIGIIGNSIFSNEYIFLWIKYSIKEIISNQTGGAQQHINRNDIKNTDIIKPDKDIYEMFMKIVIPIFKKITNNVFQIEKLEALRNTLLPKLVSGDIKVSIDE